MNSQFAVVLAFFFWVYFFRNDAYYFVRNMFMVSMGLALVGYTFYATAPPRLYPQYGFIDTINDFSSVNHDSGLAKALHQPLRGGAEHALRLLRDGRPQRLPPGQVPPGESLLGLSGH